MTKPTALGRPETDWHRPLFLPIQLYQEEPSLGQPPIAALMLEGRGQQPEHRKIQAGSSTDSKLQCSFRSFPKDWRVFGLCLFIPIFCKGEYRARMDILPGGSEKTKFTFAFFCVYYKTEKEANLGEYFIFANVNFSLLAGMLTVLCYSLSPLPILPQYTFTNTTDDHHHNHPRLSFKTGVCRC